MAQAARETGAVSVSVGMYMGLDTNLDLRDGLGRRIPASNLNSVQIGPLRLSKGLFAEFRCFYNQQRLQISGYSLSGCSGIAWPIPGNDFRASIRLMPVSASRVSGI